MRCPAPVPPQPNVINLKPSGHLEHLKAKHPFPRAKAKLGKPVPQGESTEGTDNWHTTAFPSHLVWKVLQLSEHLKDDADVTEVIMLAADLVLDEAQSTALKARLASGDLTLPVSKTVKHARQKLDVLSMHWMARIYEAFDIWAYDVIDSSPQRGWNFLVVRTDEFAFPKGISDKARLAITLDHVYMRRTCPLTCLGYGRGGLADKIYNYTHGGCLDTQDLTRWAVPFLTPHADSRHNY